VTSAPSFAAIILTSPVPAPSSKTRFPVMSPCASIHSDRRKEASQVRNPVVPPPTSREGRSRRYMFPSSGSQYVRTTSAVGERARGGSLRSLIYRNRIRSSISWILKRFKGRSYMIAETRNEVTEEKVLVAVAWRKFVDPGREDLAISSASIYINLKYPFPKRLLKQCQRGRPLKMTNGDLLQILALYRANTPLNVIFGHAQSRGAKLLITGERPGLIPLACQKWRDASETFHQSIFRPYLHNMMEEMQSSSNYHNCKPICRV
jgi:hypothetical protein